MGTEFTHLHLHTDYSLLDGACDVDKLVAHVEKIGQKAVAMTDHGNIFGAVHFFDAATKKGIKPILGVRALHLPGRGPSGLRATATSTTTCWCWRRTKSWVQATWFGSPVKQRFMASTENHG